MPATAILRFVVSVTPHLSKPIAMCTQIVGFKVGSYLTTTVRVRDFMLGNGMPAQAELVANFRGMIGSGYYEHSRSDLQQPHVVDVLISDCLPTKRTLIFTYDDDSGDGHRNLVVIHRRITLPYVRMIIEVSKERPELVRIDGPLIVLGSLEPLESLDQMHFPLLLPNSNVFGLCTCRGSMHIQGEFSPERFVEIVSDAYWQSSFNGVCPGVYLTDGLPSSSLFVHLMSFYQKGLDSYRLLPARIKMSNIVKPVPD